MYRCQAESDIPRWAPDARWRGEGRQVRCRSAFRRDSRRSSKRAPESLLGLARRAGRCALPSTRFKLRSRDAAMAGCAKVGLRPQMVERTRRDGGGVDVEDRSWLAAVSPPPQEGVGLPASSRSREVGFTGPPSLRRAQPSAHEQRHNPEPRATPGRTSCGRARRPGRSTRFAGRDGDCARATRSRV